MGGWVRGYARSYLEKEVLKNLAHNLTWLSRSGIAYVVIAKPHSSAVCVLCCIAKAPLALLSA